VESKIDSMGKKRKFSKFRKGCCIFLRKANLNIQAVHLRGGGGERKLKEMRPRSMVSGEKGSPRDELPSLLLCAYYPMIKRHLCFFVRVWSRNKRVAYNDGDRGLVQKKEKKK